jgi:muramoyltetrapeptide carboxypeptidase LdcA involved in peptidoglycan recycling
MANTGCFAEVVAVVFGNLGCDVNNVLKCFADHVKLPVYKRSLFGYGRDNIPFGYGLMGGSALVQPRRIR